MDDLDKEVLRRGGMGADTLALLTSLSMLGHPPAVEVREQLGDVLAAARIAVRLAPIGWAPSNLLPVAKYVEAGHVYEHGGASAVGEFLAAAWEESRMLPGILIRVSVLGSGIDEAIKAISEQRNVLVETAWELHEAGFYSASIPIILAQVEGICFDVSGKALFSKDVKKRADVSDEVTLAGLESALGATRDALSLDVRPSAATGALARHGIAHGREVAYGTRINSWKCWVLLLAVWEWANQRLRERDRRRVAYAESKYEGSHEIDTYGRRCDRRGFLEARLALRDLAISQTNFRRLFGRFATLLELDERLPGLGDRSGVVVAEAHSNSWWGWCRSTAGWIFAIGAADDLDGWLFWDGPERPLEGPPGEGWSAAEPPNWEGATVPGRGHPLPD